MTAEEFRQICLTLFGPEHGWQARCAAALGTDQSTVSRWVRGGIPPLEPVRPIEEADYVENIVTAFTYAVTSTDAAPEPEPLTAADGGPCRGDAKNTQQCDDFSDAGFTRCHPRLFAARLADGSNVVATISYRCRR